MIKLLTRIFIKDYKNIQDPNVRDKYGKLASIFGIISNLFVCALKLVAGLLFGFISMVADAINNLTDAGSSIITLIGFKLANKPADKDHPFGHARIEYIAGFIVSMIVVILGIQLVSNSIIEIVNNFNKPFEAMDKTKLIVTIVVLSISILCKIYQCYFYKKMGKTINSVALEATATDSRNDVIATSAVLIGLIISNIFNFYIDGYLGVLVGLFILYSGIKLIKETSDPLISEKPNVELIKELTDFIKSHDDILGIHDLQIHAYGPSTYFATLHVEVDSKKDILVTHDLIDNIEKDCFKKFNVLTTLHMDPVVINDPSTNEVKSLLLPLLQENKNITNIHDFRIVKGPSHVNIVFDAVISHDSKLSEKEIKEQLENTIVSANEKFVAVITLDRDFTPLD